jgi:murein DD-endopeptidase MepM/ murein hydrolase activator NlpD
MFFRKHKRLVSILALILALLMIVPLLISAFSMAAYAQTSDEIMEDINALQEEAEGIQAQIASTKEDIAANEAATQDVVQQKVQIDQQILLTQEQIDNTNAQIQQYSQLIAAKQTELDEAQAAYDDMYETYRLRLRAMEENSTVSYWAILFEATSLSDLLDRIDMITDIAAADQTVLTQLQAAYDAVETERQALEDDKAALAEARTSLEEQEATLDQQREEATALIASLSDENGELLEAYETFEEAEDAMSQELLEMMNAYQEKLAEEEAERIRQEEEAAAAAAAAAAAEEAERQRQEEEAAAAAAAASQSSSTSSSTSSGSTNSNSVSDSGFILPVPAGCATITDAFGMRYHPIKETYSMHSGVDLACSQGTTVSAAKSGTVVAAAYDSSYGNYVTISHSDGTSTLYGHMDTLTVSAGDYVSQGTQIGTVGSTGLSTGPHLHFQIISGGEYVNPMNYVSLY